MKQQYRTMRVVVMLAILVAGLTATAVPGAAQTFTATLHINGVSRSGPDAQVRVHQVLEDWTETGVTWNTRPAYSPDVVGSFTSGTGLLSVDITGLVQAWMSGTLNYGLLLEQDLTDYTMYSSRESSNPPYLRLCTDGVCEDLYPVADAYIWESLPNHNGNYLYLYTGLVGGYEKQSLLQFDVPVTPPPPPDEGCTRTQGYWKTHSKYGPAPYDATWDAKNGGDAEFLGAEVSYYGVLWTEPKGGNAYIILAHQYIAAELNLLSGASMSPDVSAAWGAAGELLSKYKSDQDIPKKDPDRQLAVRLAEVLDDYNNGMLGPGHCGD